MKLFGITITTKKDLKKRNAALENELAVAINAAEKARFYSEELVERLDTLYEKFPFDIGDVVYDLQLRSEKGRFTKTKASREHSLINEVEVNKKNYFSLVERYHTMDVFTDKKSAEKYLDEICIK